MREDFGIIYCRGNYAVAPVPQLLPLACTVSPSVRRACQNARVGLERLGKCERESRRWPYPSCFLLLVLPRCAEALSLYYVVRLHFFFFLASPSPMKCHSESRDLPSPCPAAPPEDKTLGVLLSTSGTERNIYNKHVNVVLANHPQVKS